MADEIILNFVVLVSIFVLSLILPFTIFVGRANVRMVRGKILEELAEIFKFTDDNTEKLIPSFEYAAYKYKALPPANDNKFTDISKKSFIMPVLIFSAICTMGFTVALGLATSFYGYAASSLIQRNFIINGLVGPNIVFSYHQWGGLVVMSFSFLGAYLYSIDYLVKRVSNFDLSPISFLRVTLHIILACIVSFTLWHAGGAIGDLAAYFESSESKSGMIVLIAFLVGFYPKLGLDILRDKFPGMQIRRVEPKSRNWAMEYPLDMITGIDTSIKFRLAEFEIEDVQNLATHNPILLFVETPYGIYEIIDWIAQAQLILAVDMDQLRALRAINVRTVFDLRNYASTPSTRALLINAFNAGTPTDFDGRPFNRGIDTSNIDVVIRTILEDLHVQRLEQVWRNIEVKLNFDRPFVARLQRRNDLRLQTVLACGRCDQ